MSLMNTQKYFQNDDKRVFKETESRIEMLVGDKYKFAIKIGKWDGIGEEHIKLCYYHFGENPKGSGKMRWNYVPNAAAIPSKVFRELVKRVL